MQHEPKLRTDSLKITPLLELLSQTQKTSNILPILTYPILENYHQWKNIVNNEYPIRSFIRGFLGVSAFVIGPIITEFSGFTWLKDRSLALYKAIPLVNLLPEQIGIIVFSSYIFSYFVIWACIIVTNLINNYKYHGMEHYLTELKLKEIHKTITSDQFNISEKEIKYIFNKINAQLIKDPKNQELNHMLKTLRNGDFQTTLDHAKILEYKIDLIGRKITYLRNLQVSTTVEANTPEHNLITDSFIPPTPELAESSINNPLVAPQRIPVEQTNYLAPAILRQYQSKAKKIKASRDLDLSANAATIEALLKDQELLVNKRYIEPKKTYSFN